LNIQHTLEIGAISLLGDTFHLVVSELVGKVEHLLVDRVAALFSIFALCRGVGTFEGKLLSTFGYDLAIYFPEAISSVDDLVGIGNDFISSQEILQNVLGWFFRTRGHDRMPCGGIDVLCILSF
jgi:hypothetical protein